MIFNQPADYNKRRNDQVLKYLEPMLSYNSYVLDVGKFNSLTESIWYRFTCAIDNTRGDLDKVFYIPCQQYDLILYSFVIEHQFNPLSTLLRLKKYLKPDGKILVIYPSNNCKLIWSKYHYHEIDHYRFQKLVEAAGLKIERFDKRKPCCKINGIRPILRYIFGYNAYYTLTR